MNIMEDGRPNFCLTICGYRKIGMSQEEYVEYMTQRHAPLVSSLMAKYNIIEYTMSHNCANPQILHQLFNDLQFSNVADYDCIVKIVFKDIDDFANLKSDPFYRKVVQLDHENFADIHRSRMSIGYIREFVKDGKAVNGNEGSSEM